MQSKQQAKERHEKREAYLFWLDLPPEERSPRTKKKMAEKLGMSMTTLVNWENEQKSFFEGQAEYLENNEYDSQGFLYSHAAKADRALIKGVMSGSPQHLKLYYDQLERRNSSGTDGTVTPASIAAARAKAAERAAKMDRGRGAVSP